MSIPWRFILALPCGFLLGVGFFIAMLYTQFGAETQSSRWTYEIVHKKQEIAAKVPGPRLLLVGGSSGLFGLDARVIQEETGCRAVNFSSHAGLGLEYILYLAEKTAKPGDTILLSLEYEFFESGFSYEVYDDYLLAHDPDYFRQLSWWEKAQMATRVSFTRIQRGWSIKRGKPEKSRPHAPYADALNDYGDEINNGVANRPSPPARDLGLKAEPLLQGLPSGPTDGAEALKAFFAWAKANHVTVLATFPNIIYHPEYDEPPGRQAVEAINAFYKSQGITVVGTARDAMLPADQFFNTYYHLTKEAAEARTRRLVPELKPYLPHGPQAGPKTSSP